MALEEIGISVASEIIKEPINDLLVIVKRHARYFFCFGNIAKDLGTEKEKLQGKLQGFLQLAEDDKYNTKRISVEVDKWLEEAKKHIKEADDIQEETNQKRKCFLGWFPNCIWQYRLSKRMAKMIVKVVGHLANTKFTCFSRLPTLTGQRPNDFMYFDSRKVYYHQLLEALRDGKIFTIGLYGMGGLGKTSLVKEVQKEVMKSKSFDKVVFVVVSNAPDVRKIQEEIAESLRLEFKEKYEPNRAERLYMRLTNGEKILLILDDVWHELDFKAIGIPLDNSHQGHCRVLLTTRCAKVCRSMDCQLQIELSMLSNEDAWNLFKKHAGIIEETPPLRLHAVAQDIADHCKGLPVAIAAVASTLKNQNPQVWEEALRTLEDSKPLANIDEELEEKIYTCLKLSYDNLKDERAKKLFLLCSLFPEDYEIPMEDLIRYGIGLGIFGDDECYGTLRLQVHRAKNKLMDSCMLVNASSGRESVKMHDLVRDVAQWIANGEIQVVMGLKRNLKAVLEDVRSKDIVKYLWLHINMIHETPNLLNSTELSILDPLNWHELKILVMTIDKKLDFIDVSDIFFKGMESLHVLTLINGERWTIGARMRIPELINLQTLRLKWWDLGDISVIGNLKRLKTLEFEKCSIMELPDGILGLKKLRLLGLLGCSVEKNPYGVIGRLSQLEELYFTKSPCFKKYAKVDGEKISEFFDEKCCLRKLDRYHIEMGGDCRLYELFEKTEKDYLKHRSLYIQCLDASTSSATFKDLVRRAEILLLQDVQGGYKSITPDVVQAIGGLNELIELHLDSCSKIHCLLDNTNQSSEIGTTFSNLVELRLKTMGSLKELCHGPSPSTFLQKLVKLDLRGCHKLQNILFLGNLNLRNLKSVEVFSCPALTSLFTLSIALSLEHLEKLTIEDCKGLKYIIADQIKKENEDNIVQEKDESDHNIGDGSLFPKLNCITIRRCNSLEWIFPLSFAGGLQQLEEMTIVGAIELKTIFSQYQHEDHRLHENPKEITLPSLRIMSFLGVPNFISIFPAFCQPNHQSLQSINLESTTLTEPEKSTRKNLEWVQPVAMARCLSKQLLNLRLLKEITLRFIPKLVSLFKLSTAQEMLLEYLEIENCHELKHIIANEQEDHDDNNYNSVIVFSRLRTVEVTNCSLLKMVLPVSLAHGLRQLESIRLASCPQIEYTFGHNDYLSRQIERDIHIEFPSLKHLNLFELPKMISICSKDYNPTWPTLKSLRSTKCPLLKTSSIIDCLTKKGSRENVIEDNQSRIEVSALENMLNYESFAIMDDGELEGIFVLEGLPSSREQTQLSSKLKFLFLKNLPKLSHICKTPVPWSFQNLGSLRVDGCGKLSYVFSACILRNLPRLEKLSIRDCDQLEQIIEDQEDHKVCFPTLGTIEIQRCNKLKSLFCSSNELPRLRQLIIKEATQLKEVFRHKMCNVEGKLMLPSLSKVELVKLPNLVCICHGLELDFVRILTVKNCPKLPSTSTATVKAFPLEHHNAEDEESKEAEDTGEEEIDGEQEVAVKDRKVIGLNKGKQPAETVLTSNETKDPQQSTNAGVGLTKESNSEEEEGKEAKMEDEAKRVMQMAVVQTTTAMTDKNAIHRDTKKGPSGIVLTNVIKDDHAEKEEVGEAHVDVAQTAIHRDKVEGSSALTNPNEGRDIARQTAAKNHSDTAATTMDDNSASELEETDNASYRGKVNVKDLSQEREGEEAKSENREDTAPYMTTKGHSEEEEEGKEAKTADEAKRVVQMERVRTTTPMTDENAIHRDTMKGPSEFVFTNLINENDHAEKEEKGEVHIEAAQTAIHQGKVIKNYSVEEGGKEAKTEDEAKRIVQIGTPMTVGNAIDHRDAMKGPLEIVLTNLIDEDEYASDGLAIPIDHIPGTTNESDLVAKQAEELPKQEEEADQMFLDDKDREETRPRKRKCSRKSQSIIASKQPADPKPKRLRKKTTITIRKSGQPVSTTVTQQEGQPSSIGENTIELSPTSANNLEIQEISSRTSSQQAVNFVENEVLTEQLDPTFDQENPDLADLNIHLEVPNPNTQLQNAAPNFRQPIQTKSQTDLVQDLTGFNDDDEDEDPFAILQSLILADESISTSSDERKAQIRQALHALDDILLKDFGTLLSNEQDREKLESNLKFLRDATESDAVIIVGLKSFILNLSEQLPRMLDSMSKSSAIEATYQSLVGHKQSVAEFHKFGVQQKKEFADKRRACTGKVEANSKQISTLEAEISKLQRKLEQLKSARPDLEATLKAVDAEEQELTRRAKDAVKDFKSTTSNILRMEVERKVMLEIKAKTVIEWQEFRNTFDSLFKKFVDN